MRQSRSRQFGLRLKPERIPWIRRGIIAVLLVALAINLMPPSFTEASSRGDGRLLYGEASVQTPRYRDWTNSTNTFTSESNVPGSGSSVHHMQSAAAPKRDEMVVAYSKQDLFSNQLQVYVWNGSTWTLGWQASIGYNSAAPRFDVAYSESTGKAFVVYSRNTGTTNELAYRTYDGTSWSAETTYDAQRTSNTVAYVKALSRPGTDEIAVIWADDSNMDMSGNYFNAATSTWSGEPATALSTNIARVGNGTSVNSDFADMAFENTSGRLVVCWGDEDVTDMKCSIRTAGTGGTWGAVQTHTSFATTPVDMKMTAEPGSDYIAYNNAQDDDTTTRSVEAAIWDGSAWGSISNYDTSINSVGGSSTNVTVDWVKSGTESRAIATYDDSVSTAIDWAVYSKNSPGSGWVIQSDITDSPAPGNLDDHMQLMRHNPYNQSELMFFIRDFGEDLIARKITFDGSNITWNTVSPSGVLETDMQSGDLNYGWGLDFSYFLYTNVIDGTTHTTANNHDGSAPTSVFINDQTGWVFHRNSGGECSYSRTTDGGTTWEAAVQVSQVSCQHVAVWYDRWTPGDNTGNYIHIVTADPGGSDDLRYNRLDVTTNTLQSGGLPPAITSTIAYTNSIIADDNYPVISKATDGTLFVGMHDSGTAGDQSFIIKCSTSCNSAANWSETSAGLNQDPGTANAKNNTLLLLPLANGDMLAVVREDTADDILSKVYHSGTSAWDGSWLTVDADAEAHARYAGHGLGAAVDKRTGAIYLSYIADTNSFGTDDDIRTAIYSGGSWTFKTDVVTNSNKGLITSQLAFDENTGDVYVVYAARTTPATDATANIYWKKSTDGMTSWGAEQGPLNNSTNDLWGLRVNIQSDERIFAMWTDAPTNTTSPRFLLGDTVANLTPPVFDQAAYRIFSNNNSADVGTTLAAQDTPASVSAGTSFRLRTLLHMTSGDGIRANYDDFKLQFVDKGSGTCAVPSGGTPASYTDVTASSVIAFQNNATPSDGANLTTNANDPTHSGHTIRNQTYEELNPFSNTVSSVASGEDAKWDFSLRDNTGVVGSSYCFRILKNDDTVLGAYSQYPEVTLVSANQSPSNPASLSQKKTNDTVLGTGDWTNENSVKFTANVSDPDSNDTLQLCVEKKPLGTSFDSNAGAETCGTGVSYSGSPVAASVTIGGHADDQYHWQARVKDAAGSYSSWVAYGSNLESERDYGVDTTAPTSGTVYDGTSNGVDAAFNDNSLSILSANWSGVNTNVSGLLRYEYSIGTTAGETDVRDWTNNSTNTSVTATGLALKTSQPYYVNVRAVDNAGNTQAAISSDGQLVLPSLSFGVSSSSVTFNNLNATNNYTDTKTSIVTTSTNAYGGYIVRAFATGNLQSGSDSIPSFSGGTYATPDSWQSGDIGFGYTSSDTSVQGVNKFQDSPCPGASAYATPGCYAPFTQSMPGEIVADHTANVTGTPIANQQFTITYRVTTTASQAAKSYNTNIVYSVLPMY